ncbi:biotin-dependent carboxyltransferase family protein [Agrobacterium sp. NPDC090283]|uniref:5-oxoprolinase subunit C family protein n=1 Tax=Agrobacterium sp. NPDC090283 TaxID=3363920 RepID=UPI00383AD20A
MIEVIVPGLATTVQDAGRFGYSKDGISPSGALDQYSYRLANALVGNPEGSSVLEITYAGPKLKFKAPAVIAATGALMQMLVNGSPVPSWESVPVSEDDEISFGYLQAGARVYLAVSGGIDVEPVMGSRSTNLLLKMGGLDGRSLAAGDVLRFGTSHDRVGTRRVEETHRPKFEKHMDLRFIPGLFSYRLTDEGFRQFCETTWISTPHADRTGFRMTSAEKQALEFKPRTPPFGAGSDPSNVVDAGYPIGSIQIPSGTEPIVLHRDAVTAGGYFTAGTVISPDLNLLAQCATKTTVRFVPIELDDAVAARVRYKSDLDQIVQQINQQS